MNSFILWENDDFIVSTPKNPHLQFSEGAHLIVAPKIDVANAWEDIDLATKTFKLASRACQIMENLRIAPWFNIQANGNWGLLPGAQPFFHVHIYGRNKTKSWGKPLILPVAPNTYENEPMPENVRRGLSEVFKSSILKNPKI